MRPSPSPQAGRAGVGSVLHPCNLFGLLGLLALLLLAACAPVGPRLRPPAVFAPARLVLVDLSAGALSHLRARPVDPATLADLPGFAPLDVGHHHTGAFSPDGLTLALITWPYGSGNAGGALHLVDLASWTEAIPGVTFNDDIWWFGFAPGGRSLLWIRPTQIDRAHGMPTEFTLERYDLETRTRTVAIALPTSFSPREAKAVGTDVLAIYGVPVDTENLAMDAPGVLFVDLAARRIVADLRLEGIKEWQYQENQPGDPEDSSRIYRPGLVWDLPRERLYVAAADRDVVVIVDLEGRRVLRRTEIQPATSLLGRLARWLIPSAEAKGTPMTSRGAFLGPDGERLYLTGNPDGADGSASRLEVVSAADLSLLEAVGPRNTHTGPYLAGCSPDGRYAYTGRAMQGPANTWEQQLAVWDLAAHRVRATRVFRDAVSPPFAGLLPGVSDDSAPCLWAMLQDGP